MTTFQPGDDVSEDRCQPIARVFIGYGAWRPQGSRYFVTSSPTVGIGDQVMAGGATFAPDQAERFVSTFNQPRIDADSLEAA